MYLGAKRRYINTLSFLFLSFYARSSPISPTENRSGTTSGGTVSTARDGVRDMSVSGPGRAVGGVCVSGQLDDL